MPRLDIWLVEQGYFSSRQTAKRAIREGHVKVNGVIAKPSKNVTNSDSIIVSDVLQDYPIGYTKLERINEKTEGRLLESVNLALDIGSSAGGFLAYLGEHAIKAIGIEVSEEFTDNLEKITKTHPSVSILIDDAFTLNPSIICRENELDLLLIDVTTDPEGTLELVNKFSSLLRAGGILVAAFKSKESREAIRQLHDRISKLDFTDIQDIILDKSRQEIHIIASRRQ